MACGTREDSKSHLPVEESLEKPDPFPSQESGDQRCLAFSQGRWERVYEDPPNWSNLAHWFAARIKLTVENVSITAFFTYLFVAAMAVLKVPKDKTRERDEMKTKVEEIKYIKLKGIEHHRWTLEEQVIFFFFHFR